VDAVLSKSAKKSWADLCDVSRTTPSEFHWPKLDAAQPARPNAQYRWVNVWASWCKPCVEELPLLMQTFQSWRAQHHPVELTLLSVDADPDSTRDFLAGRPGLPQSLRLKDAADAPTWLAQLGLSAGSSIPVHLVLNADDQLLCARAGGINRRDLESFERLLFP
jgi:thiol-disulfide isomerase/thioredoxin